MKHQPLKRLCGLVLTAAVALVLVGCNGKAGQNGRDGRDGTDGTNGTNASNVVNAALLSPEDWAKLKATVTITGASIPATAGTPEVNFRITDPAGNGIKGLGFTTLSTVPDRSGNLATIPGLSNFSFAIAKLVPENATTKAPSKWVSYVVTTVPAKKPDGTAVASAPTRPSTDNTGTLVDNGDGTYKYTFYRDIKQVQAFLDTYNFTGNSLKTDLGDVTFAPTLVHRLTLQFSGNARGTGSNTPDGVTVAAGVPMENPVNAIYDFVPGTGQPVAAGTDIRDVVSINKCNECHDKLAFHGGGRVEARYCVVCHTDQRKYGYAVAAAGTTTTFTGDTRKFAVDGATTIAAGDMTSMVHYIHMGTELTKTGYNYANEVYFDKLGYSMLDNGQRMCAKCHSDVPQAANWKAKPSRLACGTCHDGVDFSAAHGNGVIRTDDSACASCHSPEDIETNHMTPNLTKHNPKVAAGLANFTYEISSASQADVAGVPTLTVKFRILQSVDGSTPAPVTFVAPAATVANPLTGFTGGPGFLLAYAMSQDGIASPADYNNLGSGNANFQPISVSIAQLLSTNNAATMGALAGPETGTGYYTATLVGTKVFPAGAKLRSVSLQGYFTQVSPAAARHTISVVKAVSGDTVRRRVVDSAKCANCHEWFEGHGGNRVYEVQVCVQCHVPGLTTSGKGIPDDRLQAYQTGGPGGASLFTPKDIANLAAWGITIPNPVTVGSNFALAFPQTTNNMKDMIHGLHAGKDRTSPIRIVRNRTNAVAANGAINIINGGTIGFPGILNNCQSCHTYNGYNVPTTGNLLASREEAINPAGNTTTALAAAALATANAGDKMITPFTAACVTCHDSAPAKVHMTSNGGQILVDRSALNMAGESCAVCHGVGSTYDPVKVHK